MRNFECLSIIIYIVKNILTNYFSLLTVEKCLNFAHTKKGKNVQISVKLSKENLDFLNDALSSMIFESPKTCENR